MAENISRMEFERFEKDLKELLNVKFNNTNENIEKIDKKMTNIFEYQKEVIKDISKVNQKAEKANERIDKIESDLESQKKIIHGKNGDPGLIDDVREIKNHFMNIQELKKKIIYGIISLLIMSGGAVALSKLFGW